MRTRVQCPVLPFFKKKMGAPVCICNPNAGKAETGGTLGFAGRPGLPSWQAPGSVREPVSKNKVEGLERELSD